MIRFLRNNEIDYSKWDSCIEHAVNGNVTAFSWYLDIVSPGWCALVCDDYESVFPLPAGRKMGIDYIMQPVFTQQLGLFYTNKNIVSRTEEYLNAIPKHFRYIDLNLNASTPAGSGFETSEMTNLLLDLSADYNRIAAGYQSNLKRNLKKADDNRLLINNKYKPEQIIAMFRANRGRFIENLQDRHYRIFEKIAHECIQRKIGEPWAVFNEKGEAIASAFWIWHGQKVVFSFSGLTEEGKKLNAIAFLIDTFIKQHAGKPVTLDFEGSNNEGLARFYRSFGAEKEIYQRYISENLPPMLSFGIKSYRRVRFIGRKIFR